MRVEQWLAQWLREALDLRRDLEVAELLTARQEVVGSRVTYSCRTFTVRPCKTEAFALQLCFGWQADSSPGEDASPMHGSPARTSSILRVASLEEYARAGQLEQWPGRQLYARTSDNRRHVCVVFGDFTAGTDKA